MEANYHYLDAEELRIGNWINIHRKYIDPKVIPHKIDEGNDIHLVQCGQWLVSGMPMTEKILLNCGFIENRDTGQFHLEGQIVSFNELDGVNFWIMDTDKGIRCKYLHQLQNTWFVFKGNELEVNL